MELLNKEIFEGKYNLFIVYIIIIIILQSNEDNLLYPNPSVKPKSKLEGFDCSLFYELIGNIIGNAINRGIVLKYQFAEFFLNRVYI